MAGKRQLLRYVLDRFETSVSTPKESIPKRARFAIPPPPKEKAEIEVAIIGGGIGGLFSGILLKQLGIRFTIFEKDEKRVGGRVFTEYFEKKEGEQWQYAEVGAMRVPSEHRMFFELINFLNKNGANIETIPFNFSDSNNLFYFNSTRDNQNKVMTKLYAGNNPEALGFPKIISCYAKEVYEKKSDHPDEIKLFLRKDLEKSFHINATGAKVSRAERWKTIANLYDTIFEKLDEDLAEFGETEFIRRYDKYTTFDWFDCQIRDWLAEDTHQMPDELTIHALVNAVGHYAELTDSATGLNNLALVEAVIDRKNFSGTEWKTIKGGMQKLPDEMAKYLNDGNHSIKMNCNVFKLERKDNKVVVHWLEGEQKKSHEFDRVIVTAPFGSVRYWEMPQFSYLKRQAIRSLNYDHSTKIFLRFNHRFWEKTSNPIKGGSTKTDLPVRTVVYPSYGIGSEEPGVILASYTWATDAIRWSLLDRKALKTICLENLATLHEDPKIPEYFCNTDKDVIVQNWYEAFALFGPRQLLDLLVPGMLPEQHIHFVGEHVSFSHAWIVGALYSAHRAIKEILVLENTMDDAISSWDQFSEWYNLEDWRTWVENIKLPAYHNL